MSTHARSFTFEDIQKAGADLTGDDTEALELAHQQELQDLEDRLTDKHRKEKDNLETQFKSRLDDIEEKHRLEIERLKNELLQAQQALDQYPDIQEEVMSPVQAVPTVSCVNLFKINGFICLAV